jgi:hypothetical protein
LYCRERKITVEVELRTVTSNHVITIIMISLQPIHLVVICVALSQAYITLSFTPVRTMCPFTLGPHSRSIGHVSAMRMSKEDDMFTDQEEGEGEKSVMNTDDIEYGEIPDDFLEGMQDSAPGQLEIMKQVRR